VISERFDNNVMLTAKFSYATDQTERSKNARLF